MIEGPAKLQWVIPFNADIIQWDHLYAASRLLSAKIHRLRYVFEKELKIGCSQPTLTVRLSIRKPR